MNKRTEILGVFLSNVTMSDAVDKVIAFTKADKAHTVFTPNAEILMSAQRDDELRTILNSSDLLVADGAGVILASKILNKDLNEKVSGVDLTRNLFAKTKDTEISFFLFGGKPGVVEKAKENLISTYGNVNIKGLRHGYFSAEDEERIIEEINNSGSDILLVGLGAPKQEKWIYANKDRLKVKVCMGIGGSLDVFAGTAKLAPEIMRKNGLEWLYRLYKEPWRYKRMLDLPRFVILTLRTRIGF